MKSKIPIDDFESILVQENNGKQNPDEYYKNKYQNHVAYSFVHKLICVDDKLEIKKMSDDYIKNYEQK